MPRVSPGQERWESCSRNPDAYELAFGAWQAHGVEQRRGHRLRRLGRSTQDKSDSSWGEMLQYIESAVTGCKLKGRRCGRDRLPR